MEGISCIYLYIGIEYVRQSHNDLIASWHTDQGQPASPNSFTTSHYGPVTPQTARTACAVGTHNISSIGDLRRKSKDIDYTVKASKRSKPAIFVLCPNLYLGESSRELGGGDGAKDSK